MELYPHIFSSLTFFESLISSSSLYPDSPYFAACKRVIEKFFQHIEFVKKKSSFLSLNQHNVCLVMDITTTLINSSIDIFAVLFISDADGWKVSRMNLAHSQSYCLSRLEVTYVVVSVLSVRLKILSVLKLKNKQTKKKYRFVCFDFVLVRTQAGTLVRKPHNLTVLRFSQKMNSEM